MNVRLLNDRLIVELEKKPEMIGVIHVPDGAYTDTNGMAKVLAVGPGRELPNGTRVPVDVKVGQRVCIIRLHERTSTQEQLQETLGEGQLILREDDILYVEEEG